MDDERLRHKVRSAYSAAAENPAGLHAFPLGRTFAESLGYSKSCLAGIPSSSIEAFSGVSNVSLYAEIPQGATVLDLGCGGGLDSLIAAQRVGSSGRVIGVDFSSEMLARARNAATEAAKANVLFCQADAEQLPLDSASIDVALVNGIFNLNPAREAIFHELARSLRKGGAVYVAELILREPLPPETRASESDWFA